MESVLRTQFAYIFARDVSPYQKYLDENCYLPSTTQGLVTDNIFKDLDRSKEPYVAHFRVLDDSKPPSDPTYPKMPIWAAVEAMSFGTLSKCLERCRDQEITKLVADAVGVTRQGFASQIRSFVYLRNRSAHHSRLWNHSVIDAPPLANNVRNRAKRSYGQFDTRSIFQVIVVLANFLDKAGLDNKFIQEAEELLARNSDFNQGIKNPTKIAK